VSLIIVLEDGSLADIGFVNHLSIVEHSTSLVYPLQNCNLKLSFDCRRDESSPKSEPCQLG
jgi:hypothetical protein